jgi:hypothetical protein
VYAALYVPSGTAHAPALAVSLCPLLGEEGKELTGFKDLYLKAKAKIWAWLPQMCHACCIAVPLLLFYYSRPRVE